jgi:hypothetical protein
MTNQFDLNKFNSFIESANNIISCDSECQKKKTAEQLKNKLSTAESNLTLAVPQFEIAKQNYYTYISGQSGYNELMEQELTEKASVFVKLFKDSYEIEFLKIRTQLDTYNGLLINFKNIVDLYKQYKKENIQLSKELKDETNDILTNDRKTYYQNQQIDGLNSIYYYLLWIIYSLIVCCFFVFSIIYPSTYNWKVRLFILIIFIVLCFMDTSLK